MIDQPINVENTGNSLKDIDVNALSEEDFAALQEFVKIQEESLFKITDEYAQMNSEIEEAIAPELAELDALAEEVEAVNKEAIADSEEHDANEARNAIAQA